MAKSSLFAWALRASHPRPTTGIADALARSAAMDCVLAKNLMNSRRSMGFPRAKGHVGQVNNITFLDRELWRETLPGQAAVVRSTPKTDIADTMTNVRFVP
jgi:hypothetical protein